MADFMDLLPFFIFVIIPIVLIVIVAIIKINADKQRSRIIIRAVESNYDINTDKLAKSLNISEKSPTEISSIRLLRGCIFSLAGIFLFIFSLITYANGNVVRNGEIIQVGFMKDAVYFPFMFGCISLAVGISYLIVFFIMHKQAAGDKKTSL